MMVALVSKLMKSVQKNKYLKNLTKSVIEELIENFYVCEEENVKITFKYKEKYNEAIDFMKQHECDIISKINVAI